MQQPLNSPDAGTDADISANATANAGSRPRPRPLQGVRILDLSRVLAGPWCTQNLADLGAEVIKIERPGSGDETRAWGPPYLCDDSGHETSESAYYLAANRGKRSVAIDIGTAAGAALVTRLALTSDVLVENFKLDGLKQYGLDYETLSALNPRLIYCSVTGFGQNGPLASRAGYDFLIQGMGGLMSITGEPDGAPGGGPQKVGVAVTDLMAGMYATTGILAALMERDTSGRGQHIDIALFDCQIAMLANQASNYLHSGRTPVRLGNAHPNVVPYQTFATLDGHIILACGNDRQFRALCLAMNRPDIAANARYATNSARSVHRDQLIPLLAEVFLNRSSERWITDLEQAGVPCGPINTIEQALTSAQVQHRRIVREIDHPLGARALTVASPLRLSATPVEYRSAPPLLGEHTGQVLQEILGLTDEDVSALTQAGAIGELHQRSPQVAARPAA